MSLALPIISLTTATVGTTGSIDLSSAAPQSQLTPGGFLKPASLVLFNESGCGLTLVFLPSSMTAQLPAGGWRAYKLTPGDVSVTYTVSYLIPGAQIAVLMPEYYQPWEEVAPVGLLGNSPLGVGGVVNIIGTTSSSGTTPPQTIQEKVTSGSTNSSGQALAFTHGLSVVPSFAFVQIRQANAAKKVSVTNYTSTTVDVYNAGGVRNFLLYVIRIN